MPRNRPIVALRALLELARDPDDLPQVFKIIDALPGRGIERIHARMLTTASGRELLASRPDLGARLADRATLAALPDGTLGHGYATLTARAGITAEGIVEASMAAGDAPVPESPEVQFAGERMRDSHDLWHVVTGYGTDVVGELALLAFTFAQAPHLGIGLICGFAMLHRVPEINTTMKLAYRRGKRAAYLPAVAWERELARPLDEVRTRLLVGPPPSYTPITTAELRRSNFLGVTVP
jgi:ubiquinone biosynthesis protein COQ4